MLVDGVGRVLLLQGADPADATASSWWFTPGGGLEPGETAESAARREVLEETGIALGDLGPVVLTRRTRFVFDGRLLDQVEDYFCVRVSLVPDVTDRGWTADERRWLRGWRWWPVGELPGAREPVYPECLAALLEWAPYET